MQVDNKDIVNIVMNTLNLFSGELVEHGKRVSFSVYKMLVYQKKYNAAQKRDICFLALMHDIGAFKTEEVNKLLNFEFTDITEHSIYGYLFFQLFSPLRSLAPAILYHHTKYEDMQNVEPFFREISQIIQIADRADIFQRHGKDVYDYIDKYQDTVFDRDVVTLFKEANEDFSGTDDEYYHAMYDVPFTPREVEDFFRMIISIIDFRSRQTVTHTIITSRLSVEIALLFEMSGEDIEKIKYGSLLHDLGKMATPVEILESPERLNAKEMAVMRRHVEMTERVLKGNIDPEVLNIAARHHERLDGSGYHKGLEEKDLTLSERIVAVADIMSALCGVRTYKAAFPKEKIIDILLEMSENGYIDKEVAKTVTDNFDALLSKVKEETTAAISAYETINSEHKRLTKKRFDN